MTGPLGLSKATLGVCFALGFLQSPGVFAFVVAPSLGSTARWCTNPATSTSTQASRGTQPIKASRGSRASAAGMSSSPTEVPTTATGTEEKKVDPYVTELPDSFEDSVDRMGKATLQSMEEGQKLLRIDFDTSAGDETYTTLKSSLEMAKQLTKVLAEALICGGGEEGGAEERKGATLALFFPDAGSAALAKFEWGAGTDAAQVPDGVRFCTVKTEGPVDSDVGCILLCPRNSEADFALELVKKVEAQRQFMVLVNPALINMGTTGYGLAGRRIRDEIISKFQTSYYLRTLPWGAVTKEHGKRYTVWQDDANDPSGYRLLKAVSERPLGEALDDIYNIANGLADEESTPEFLNSVAKFVRDFGRM